MMNLKSLLLLSCCFSVSFAYSQSKLLSYADPLVGTAKSTTISALKHGDEGTEKFANTIPAVGLPFGMTQWTPQTNTSEQKCLPPYLYSASKINGFRATHWLSGSCTQDYGSFTVMPITGSLETDVKKYASPFSHQEEVSAPNYYKVKLGRYDLVTEITATLRAGIMRITTQKTDSLYILITPNSDQQKGYVKVDAAAGEITGYNPAYRIYQGLGKPAGFSGYFVAKLQKQASTVGTYSSTGRNRDLEIKNQRDLGAYVGFKAKKGEVYVLKFGTSFTSIEQARKNMNAEIPAWDFDQVRTNAAQVWEKAFKGIEVKGNEKDKQVFYTAMYHTMQLPRLFNDVDGTYPEFSKQYQSLHLPKGRNYYDDFSMWDIYRAELPLLEITRPKLVGDLVNSIVLKGEQGGWLPIFPCWNSYTNAMIGDHSTAFIASAFAKGIEGYDIERAYGLMRKNAFEAPSAEDYKDGKGRRALAPYLKYGYLPLEEPVKDAFHKNEQVSRTLEYAYDDYALAMVAKKLNKQSDYAALLKRSGNYKQVFDPKVGLMRGKYENGSWISPFFPDKKVSYITEGTPRQYSFYVPHDVPGLADMMGGKKNLEMALDTLFNQGEYWHGNEPGNQTPFMYNFTDAPWKTQQVVHQIRAEEYTTGPGGLSGNDDAGQMSAWYVFAAMGLYPVDPVSGRYELTSPLFNEISIRLENGKLFQIRTIKPNEKCIYIRSIKINGKQRMDNHISFAEIQAGGVLEITLAEKA